MDKWFSDLTFWIQSWDFGLRLGVTLGFAAVAMWFLSKVYVAKEAKIKPIPFILFIVCAAIAFFVGMAGPPVG